MVDTESVLSRTPPKADQRVSYGESPLQFADLRLPKGLGPYPAVAFIHGGFWRNRYDLSHTGHICAAMTKAGMATWNLEYRRIGDEGGAWPGTFLDVAAGLRHLFQVAPEYGIDRERVIVAGHSAGGHLALWAAGLGRVPEDSPIYAERLPVRAAVSLAGVPDLREVWRLQLSNGVVGDLLGGSPEALPGRYRAASPAELLPLGVRQLLIHGAKDDIAPVSITRGYARAATAAGDDALLLVLPETEHFAVIEPESDVWPGILSAIMGLLAG